MSTVNLYDVLNVSNDSTKQEIKEAYIKLAKEFHPDKPSGDPEMFELITHAYNILINTQSRKEFDELFKLSKQTETSHFDLKSQSSNYLKAQDSDVLSKSKEKSALEFEKAFLDFDRKHGYKRDHDDKAINEKDTNRMLRDLQLAREQDDIESIHEKIFEGSRFDLAKFNAAFDALHKTHDEMIPHSGNPDAYNVVGGFDSNFSSIENYENLYAEDDLLGTPQFGSIKLDKPKKKRITKDDIDKIKSVDYTKGHNIKEKDYNKTLEERLKEREFETKKYEDRDMTEFNTDPTCGGYSIFENIGLKNLSTISWDNDDDIKSKYKKLLDMRKSDIN